MYEGASSGTMSTGYAKRIAPPEGVMLRQADVAPVRPVPHALDMCGGQLNDLHEALDELERRLASVLLPTPPTGNAVEKNVPSPVRSDMGERLGQVSVGIVAARNRVAAILDRLEV